MGSRERRERERTDVRQKIMDAARTLFASEGFEAVSMRKIADAIEYSPTAIYLHFEDKTDLFRQLCSEDFDRLSQVFRDLNTITDPVQRLRELGRTYVRFAVKFPHHYRLMFMTPRIPQAGEKELKKKGNPDEDGYAYLRRCISDVVAADRFRPDLKDVELLAQAFWSTAHGVASLEIIKSCDDWISWRGVDAISDLALDGLLAGLLRKPPTRRTPSRGRPRSRAGKVGAR